MTLSNITNARTKRTSINMIVGGQICRTQNVNEISRRGFNNKSNNIEWWFIYELGFNIAHFYSRRARWYVIYLYTYVSYIVEIFIRPQGQIRIAWNISKMSHYGAYLFYLTNELIIWHTFDTTYVFKFRFFIFKCEKDASLERQESILLVIFARK